MPKARWPNLDIAEPYEIFAEGEQVASFASKCWLRRIGGAGTRDPLLQPRNVQITVGKECRDITSQVSFTGAGSAATSAAGRRYSATITHPTGRSKDLSSRGEPRPRHGKRLPQPSPDVFQVFQCQDFILVESPILCDMYKALPKRPDQGSKTHMRLGPINRHAELLEPVLVMMKLRWLVRLHSAMVSYAGGVCSLARYLKGVLTDSSGCHLHVHSPIPYFDQMTESLKQSLTANWPLFISYVTHHDRETASMATDATSGGTFGNARGNLEVVDQLVDDIFVTWMSQQSAAKYPVEMIMDELDFFQLRRPTMKFTLERLQIWCSAVHSAKYRYTRGAQQQAAHLAVMMDWPSMWPNWQHTKEQVLDMARMIVSHPRTFNTGIRSRVAAHLTDETTHVDSMGAVCPTFAETINLEQKSMIYNSLVTPRDQGNVSIQTIGRNEWGHDLRPPWLVGTESRVQDTSKFHERMARKITTAEGGTPRLPQIAVKIIAT